MRCTSRVRRTCASPHCGTRRSASLPATEVGRHGWRSIREGGKISKKKNSKNGFGPESILGQSLQMRQLDALSRNVADVDMWYAPRRARAGERLNHPRACGAGRHAGPGTSCNASAASNKRSAGRRRQSSANASKSCAVRALKRALRLAAANKEEHRQEVGPLPSRASRCAPRAAARTSGEPQRRSGDVGRTPLAEHESLLKQLAEAGLQALVQGKLVSFHRVCAHDGEPHDDAGAVGHRCRSAPELHAAVPLEARCGNEHNPSGRGRGGEAERDTGRRARGADVLAQRAQHCARSLPGRTGTSARRRAARSSRGCAGHAAVARVGRMVARGIAHPRRRTPRWAPRSRTRQQRAVFTRVQERLTA